MLELTPFRKIRLPDGSGFVSFEIAREQAEVGSRRRRIGNIHWRATSNAPITADTASRAQADAGYHPQGYSFYDFRAGDNAADNIATGEGAYYAVWQCSESSD